MNFALRALLEVQETTLLAARAARRLFRRPAYVTEMVTQMDVIGVGSLTIILLTGFFTGGVLALQTYPTLKYYGAQEQTGRLVATALVRELGPVLSGLMVAGRVASAIAAELGSMVVSQQIDAMRALRSEEHTSELQSRQYLVCRLLLEKKKNKSLLITCPSS